MKTKTHVILMVLSLLAYFSGLRTANAFYDPGMQRWLNRDPVEEYRGINLYCFVDNCPITKADIRGLCPDDCWNQLQKAESDIQQAYGRCLAWAYGIYGGLQVIARPRPPINAPGLLLGLAGCGARAVVAQDEALAAYVGCEVGKAPEPPYHPVFTVP